MDPSIHHHLLLVVHDLPRILLVNIIVDICCLKLTDDLGIVHLLLQGHLL